MSNPSVDSPMLLNRSPSAPPDVQRIHETLARHADNPSAFLALNTDTRHYSVPGVDGLIAYCPAGRRHLVQFGGVFADGSDQDRLLESFRAMATEQRRRVVAIQLLRADAERYAAHGFTVNQFGASYARSLEGLTFKGSAHMRLRNKVSRAKRAGVVVAEIGADQEMSDELEARLGAVDATWLHSKGRHVKELTFMVGERGGRAAALRRLFVALDGERKVLGYITFSPVYGERAGWLHDLSRRLPDAPPGTMETIIVAAVDRFRQEQVGYLHFGLTPFTGLADEHELPGASGVASRIVRLLAAHGKSIYPAADQLAYKQKWSPDLVQPEYVAFDGRVSARAVWSLLRLTNAA